MKRGGEKFFKGREFAKEWERCLKKEFLSLKKGLVLGVVLVGDDPASILYVRKKEEMARRLGVDFRLARLEGEKEVREKIKEWNKKKEVNGIMMQLPLSKGLRDIQSELVSLIDRGKDVDGLREKSEREAGVVRAVREVLEQELVEEVKKWQRIVVVGRGVVGKNIVQMWKRIKAEKDLDFSVVWVAGRDENLKEYTSGADVIVTAVGCKSGLLTGEMVKKGVVVFDLGTMKVEGGVGLAGDVDLKTVSGKASWVAGVPGGMGPVTVTALFANLVELVGKRSERD